MNTLEFAASTISSVIWPCTVVSLAIVFRVELRKLLTRITRIRHGESEAEFAQQVQDAAARVEKLSEGALPGLLTPEAKRIFAIWKIDSRAALIAAWVEFEGAARTAIHGHPPDEGSKFAATPLILEKLKELGIIELEDAKLLGLLRRLRNVALHHHNEEIDASTAYKAISVLLQLTWEVKQRK